jgi:hypothetical protein
MNINLTPLAVKNEWLHEVFPGIAKLVNLA